MMTLRSFRLRIALLAAALAGGALIGFGMVSWWLIYSAKVDRLDAELKNQFIRATRPARAEEWQLFEASLSRAFGGNTDTSVLLWVADSNGNTLYRSSDWLPDLKIDSLSFQTLSLLPAFLSATPYLSPHSDRPFSDRPFPDRRRSTWERLPDRPPPPPKITTQHTASGLWRVGVVVLPYQQVAIAINLSAIDQEMTLIRGVFFVAIPVVLLLVAGGAWAIAGSALHPVGQLTHAIRQVTAKGLDQRLPTQAATIEFVELIQVFNQMLERLERSFKQASRFSADAAHELKTPLTILQGELEQALQLAPSGSIVQQRLSTLLDEVHRLSEIVRKLLLLSLADAGKMGLHPVEIDLSTLLVEMGEDVELMAPRLVVETDVAEGLRVWGDRDLLQQALQNLMSNAVKYNLPEGWVKIQGHQRNGTVQVTIRNASNPIPESDRPLIFDRFYRGDPARTRKIEGLGLGLSLAREIIHAHQGELTLEPPQPGETAFTLRLPLRQG
ncbi:HAMP domain-containing protein [Oscillatoria sp. FACHB-1407]|uniref:ATP-binding protein n=1 Tax=Oscillatoria sp. FACHB-1407 TaxID=2692847 RepID=UPI0016856DEA|nr:ATP-binding protein [Oscillatoria sp. FACHB-1407]MBD2464210.1 HAMP domain-containing protein [Oscillatoria sp. FACHB-1407]